MIFLKELTTLLRIIWQHPANRGARFSALKRFLLWQLWKRAMRTPVIVPVLDRRQFLVVPDSEFSSLVVYNRLPDWDELNLLQRVLRPDDGFVDIGANVGYYSVFASALVDRGPIHAIEANPRNVAVILKQKHLNDLAHLTVHGCAVGAGRGSIGFDPSLREMGAVSREAKAGVSLVECRPLDEIMAGVSTPCVAKMDIEGYEVEALRGASHVLQSRKIWLWVFENNPSGLKQQGTGSRALLEFFRTAGYTLLEYSEDPKACRVFQPAESAELCNLVACSDLGLLQARLGPQIHFTGTAATP